jgi:hypothetical protein
LYFIICHILLNIIIHYVEIVYIQSPVTTGEFPKLDVMLNAQNDSASYPPAEGPLYPIDWVFPSQSTKVAPPTLVPPIVYS